jgi:hypothetical protein
VFLDAWLRLSIFGPVILLIVLIGALVYALALFRAVASCRRLLRENELEQFWLTASLVILLIVPIAVLLFRWASV